MFKGGTNRRIIAISLNLIALGTLVFLVITEGLPRVEEPEAWFGFGMFFATPTGSLIALFRHRQRGGNGWLSLYFKRRALEEKKKIEDLSNKTESLQAPELYYGLRRYLIKCVVIN